MVVQPAPDQANGLHEEEALGEDDYFDSLGNRVEPPSDESESDLPPLSMVPRDIY